MRILKQLTLISALLAIPAAAQTITGAFTGTLADQSGAVIPNAKVTATNTGTNVTYTATSNDSGVYNLLFLPVGSYNLVAEVKGFKKGTAGPFGLQVNQTARVDFKLEVGETTQSVEITAAAPVLQTESTQTGESLQSKQLTELPLKGRNFVSLTLLIPGAVSPQPDAMAGRFGARPYVNGNREQTNNFMLDGVDVNDSIDNRVGYSPNVDALEEVKVLTGNAAADYGNSGGATVMMSIKSGTNQFHGNVFEFLQNTALNANGFFRNRNVSTATRTGFKRNIFGGTLGGPIKKNKLFFFVDYEGTLQRTDGPATASVAPQAWRNGDLSQFPNASITDPTNGQPFAGKQIPVSRFSPVARYLFSNPSLYPLPTQAGTGPLGIGGNFASSSAGKLDNHQADAKVDYRPTDKDAFMARWSIGRYESITSRAALPVNMTGGQSGPTTSWVGNWNRTVSSSIVNEARFSFSRIQIDDLVLDWSGQLGADGNSKFGIPGGQPIPGLSSVGLGSGLTGIGSAANISNTVDKKYIIYDNLTWQKGKHLLKMGTQLMKYNQDRYYAGNNGALGLFRYTGTYTGLDFADFLTDSLNSKGRGAVAAPWGHRYWRNALFIQDDYKVSRNFTLNIGMRWEYMQPIYEKDNRQINLNTYTGELIKPGGEFGNALYKPYKKQFMPRIGFAWTPEQFKSKLVVRGGYAYQSFMEGTGANLRLPLNPPFFVETDFAYDTRTPGTIRTGFSDVVTANISLDMARPAGVTTPQLLARAWDLNLRPQTTGQINFTTEYQFDNSTSLQVGYVGQKGTHLVAPVEANQPLPGVGPFSTWTNLNLRRPLINKLPNVANVPRTESSATMDYHSLQVVGRRKFAAGFDFLASYTYGKTLTDNTGYYGSGLTAGEGAYWQNAYDRRANRGPSFFDIRSNFTVAGSWFVPVGKGKKFGSGMGKAADLVVGGWNLNYSVAARTGVPITIMANDLTNQAVRGNIRANRYRTFSINESARNVDNWFGLPTDSAARGAFFCGAGVDNGTCSYGQPGNGSFGNSGIGTERGPGYFSTDMSIGKRFNVSEKNYLDFRMELFNAFNNVSFAPPGSRNVSAPATFGVIGSQVQAPRNIQFGLKYFF